MIRQHAPQVYNGLKSSWKALVQLLGGVDATAACTRASRSLASDYGSTVSERFAPIDVILDAETVAEQPLVTAALARAQGYELVPVVPREGALLAAELARIGADMGDLFARAAGVLAGARLSDTDADAMLRDLDDMIDTARDARGAIRRLRKGA